MRLEGANFVILCPLILCSLVSESSSVEIIRRKTGDSSPGLFCSGTIIVNDDFTHSLSCAKSLFEAGCDMRFSDSLDIKSADERGINNPYIILPYGQKSFCRVGNIVTGDIMLQDYPNNLNTPIWYAQQGVEKVKKSISYTLLSNQKIELHFTSHWPGLLVKVQVKCVNRTGAEVEKNERRCVIVKHTGFVSFPLTENSFTSTKIKITTTSETTSTKEFTRNPVVLNIEPTNDGNEEVAFAVVAGFGALFIVLCVAVTVFCITLLREERRKEQTNNTNKNNYDYDDNNEDAAVNDIVETCSHEEVVTEVTSTKKQQSKNTNASKIFRVFKKRTKKKTAKNDFSHVSPILSSIENNILSDIQQSEQHSFHAYSNQDIENQWKIENPGNNRGEFSHRIHVSTPQDSFQQNQQTLSENGDDDTYNQVQEPFSETYNDIQFKFQNDIIEYGESYVQSDHESDVTVHVKNDAGRHQQSDYHRQKLSEYTKNERQRTTKSDNVGEFINETYTLDNTATNHHVDLSESIEAMFDLEDSVEELDDLEEETYYNKYDVEDSRDLFI